MWKCELENNDFKVLLLNAWETDYLQDPLFIITAELTSFFETSQRGLQKTATEFRKAGEKLVRVTMPLMTGVVSIDSNPLTKTFGGWISKIIEKRFQQYEDGKKDVTNFKKHLVSSTEALTKDGKQLIVIVDELDRCRPTYAVAFLERIKHLFNVDGISYILAIDADQLNNTVKSVYGIRDEAKALAYLRRFIDYRFRLPDPNVNDFCMYLFESFGLSALVQLQDKSIQDAFISDCVYLFTIKKFSLREIEQAFTEIRLALYSFQRFNEMYLDLVPIMVTIRNNDFALYEKMKNGSGWFRDVRLWAGDPGGNGPLSYVLSLLEAIHASFYLQGTEKREEINRLYERGSASLSRQEAAMVRYLDIFSRGDRTNPLHHVIKQIDLLNEISPEK